MAKIEKNSHIVQPIQGSRVYIPCSTDGWTSAIVTDIDLQSATVTRTGDGQSECLMSNKLVLQPFSADLACIEDLIQLNPVSVPAVLESLYQRYCEREYYTYAGPTLVCLNPCQNVSSLYGPHIAWKIHAWNTMADSNQRPPHVYTIAQKSFQNLKSLVNYSNQSIIISGESGAGKTVNARHVIKYLVTVSGIEDHSSGVHNHSIHGIRSCINGASDIEQKILDSNPILEAFGNASTLRNFNSSRFGKYVELHFDSTQHIVGATLKTYLLEKSRVVHQAPKECNFHIFYQFLHSCTDLIENMCGTDILNDHISSAFHVVNGSDRDIDNDKKCYKEVLTALEDIGLDQDQIYSIWQMLVGIMLLCNLKFTSDEDDLEACDIDENHIGAEDKINELLGLSSSDLGITLTRRKITAMHAKRKSVFHKPCNVTEATNRRDCMVKLLYDRLFEWIVAFINSHVKGNMETHGVHKIGILDIYGFESFMHNSLEQLCINYANEKLQQHFVQHFLKKLQEEYVREALPFEVCDITDNCECIHLIEGKPGIISILDEVCRLNRPMDPAALSVYVMTSLPNTLISRPSKDFHKEGFTVVHYVHPVTYGTENILDKNKDDIPPEILELLQASNNTFICELVSDFFIEEQGLRKKTVLTKFKTSLDYLMNTLQQTEPHYIRCIKPNRQCLPENFDKAFILSQLQACGVAETVNISKQTFPSSMEYPVFLKYFSLILRSKDNQHINNESLNQKNIDSDALLEPLEILYNKQLDITPRKCSSPRRNQRRRAGLSSADHTRKLCATIMKTVFRDDYTERHIYTQFGRTKIFLKQVQLECLEMARLNCLSENAFTIQCSWRRYKQRKRMRHIEAVSLIQNNVRGWIARKNYQQRHTAAMVIQTAYRSHMAAMVIHTVSTTENCTDCSKMNKEHSTSPMKPNCTDHQISPIASSKLYNNTVLNNNLAKTGSHFYSEVNCNIERNIKLPLEVSHCEKNDIALYHDSVLESKKVCSALHSNGGPVHSKIETSAENRTSWPSWLSGCPTKDLVLLSAVVGVALYLGKANH